MLEHERTAFVGMAFQALRLPEATEQRARCGGMRIVTGRALERTVEPMALIELEDREHVGVAVQTQPARYADPAERIPRIRRLAQ